ncbi:formate dehydrogenase accessory sulfurtransferase FdhD [Corynebacterium pacaense]|uniref:formate dehydrogenase accessory sulfurtransferase FdhD n=1 Tax=Corynebacterium pacaense TaxID=1816684 RepID=UPI0009BA77F6|nr:formate dehydrogenase accessory sulfurtransferase FdhD [Corynebacterium pacaense]
MGRITQNLRVARVVVDDEAVGVDSRADTVAVEEPLEIRVNGTALTTTMRTPGHDIELVHGLLLSEGVIGEAAEVSTARYCAGATGPDGANTYNVLEVEVTPAGPLSELNLLSIRRNLPTSSACGICGTTSIDQILHKRTRPGAPIQPDPRMIITLPGKLRAHQKLFDRTGGVHAAGIATIDGELLVVREDVGRHNAADKAIGHMLMRDAASLEGTILLMSSRASFELVQKAAMAGISGVVAVSAATSLAIDAAREAGIFLAGFLRGGRFNHYAGELARTPDGDLS